MQKKEFRKKKLSPIAVIDFETDPFDFGVVPAPFAVGYYDEEQYQYFWGDDCAKQLMDFLKDEPTRVIYAHNGGKFDFFYLLDYFDESLLMINGRIAQASILGGLHELRDSYLILPMPLKVHGKKHISYRKFRKQWREKYKHQILDYLKTDCESLFNWVSRFQALYGNGLTLAGTAFKELKKTGYAIQNTSEAFDELFRDFYFGGRVECREVGVFYGDYKYMDINSAYSFAMMDSHWQGGKYTETFRLPVKGSYFVVIKGVSRGALPIKQEGKLQFPNDDLERVYFASGWEIQAGLDTNTLVISEIIKVYVPSARSSFSDYVNHFFAVKKDAEERGDLTERLFAKLMLNSAYGKFGQDGRKFQEFAIAGVGGYPEGKDWEPYSDLENGYSVFCKPAPTDRFYNVATAASITGWVRAYLWRAICASQGVLYCDTDSIICREFGGDIGDKLGQWKVEAEPTEVYIAQRKMYALKMQDGSTKKACKGVRLTFNQIKNSVINKQNVTFKRAAPAFSLKYGPRFFERTINFAKYEENHLQKPVK